MKIYIAARFSRRPEAFALATALQRHGHEVTARWVLRHEDHTMPPGLSPQAEDAERARFAAEDVEDMDRANACVSLMEGAPEQQPRRPPRRIRVHARPALSTGQARARLSGHYRPPGDGLSPSPRRDALRQYGRLRGRVGGRDVRARLFSDQLKEAGIAAALTGDGSEPVVVVRWGNRGPEHVVQHVKFRRDKDNSAKIILEF